MNKSLTIAELGNPILRQQAQEITQIRDPNLQGLIDALIAKTLEASGVGIAAPQVSHSLRLFILASHPNPRYPNAPNMDPIAMINPRILSHSQEMVKDWEGCLSVPGVRGLVPRYQWVEVEYCDRFGQFQQQKLTDFVARIFQHELDHLNGLIFLDRVKNPEDLQDLTNQSIQGHSEKP
ncbi:peptide deformylase [Rippkaea orientalis PCC 8801]|uniref:Peptide deformylase n=1 Tax=Rippkaea orientalis (strain PCC 8801 / RF-1) TaxID=41431 RepID=B7JWM6_RIPO1|nr:peptide deformylase [Rippkaea orientalis]ACK68367.1 peptide deformylase [Rippkaea orientalis PCC 8801]